MKKSFYILLIAVFVAGACGNYRKTVDPGRANTLPKGIKDAQRDTSVTGRKDTTDRK